VTASNHDLHTHVETLVVGGSQAGLATAYELGRRGRRCLVLDAHDRVGDAWRRRWDSLRLFTTARYDGLPGMPFPAPRSAYPTKDEVADYLESYAETFALPVLTGTTVERLDHDGATFRATAGARTFSADNVVLATGAYRTPRIPPWAGSLHRDITQLHSSAYRNPSQVPPGRALVVGAGNSGAEIAIELAADHPVQLAGRDTGQEPTRAGTVPDRMLMPLIWFVASRVLTVHSPVGRRACNHFLHPPRGIPLGRVRRQDLTAAGIERVPRVAGVDDGHPALEDGTVLDVATVVWCTGFDIDLSYVALPLTTTDGYPAHRDGAVDGVQGLYVVGLPFIRSLSSVLLGGVGRDAWGIAAHIARRSSTPAWPGRRGRRQARG
jgi:putative flavoprotein involved in K+ transport